MSNTSLNNISFKATPTEIKSIKKIFNNFEENPSNTINEQSFDVAEINGKAYITKHKMKNSSRIEFELIKDGKTKAGTVIYTNEPDFFKKKSSLIQFEKILDTLKNIVNKANEREVWTD